MVIKAWLNRRKVEVPTAEGVLRGRLESDPGTGKLVAAFRGIPYAAPPLGNLRWKPPQPVEPWVGSKDALKDGPEAPQLGVDFMPFLREVVEKHGFNTVRRRATLHGVRALRPLLSNRSNEDCLYLNIRSPHPKLCDPSSPAAAAAPLLPVMVYLHGGDHHDGGGSGRPYYRPNVLPARGNVVLVTFNYRLGIFGHMAHPELSAEDKVAGGPGVCGNYSLLDQIAALKWVQRNVAAFGGDANNVTLFGSSAGGESVTYMMTSPLARGLFHRAIAQSPGSSVNSLLLLRQPFACFLPAEANGSDFARRNVGEAPGQIERLRTLPAAELQRRYRADAAAEPQPRQLFYPVVDGHVLPLPPLEAFLRGEQAAVPFLVGCNRDEGSLCFSVTRGRTLLRDALYPSPVRHGVGHEAYGGDDGAAAAALADMYDPSWRSRGETDCRADQAFLTDCVFGAKVRWLAANHARRGNPVYTYEFAVAPPLPGQRVGAFHGAEVPFVFGAKPWFAGGGAEDVALSLTMVDYWAAFARTGDPNATDAAAAPAGPATAAAAALALSRVPAAGAGEGVGVGSAAAALTTAKRLLARERPLWPRYSGADDDLRLVLNHTIETKPFDRLPQLSVLADQMHVALAAHAAARTGDGAVRWPWRVLTRSAWHHNSAAGAAPADATAAAAAAVNADAAAAAVEAIVGAIEAEEEGTAMPCKRQRVSEPALKAGHDVREAEAPDAKRAARRALSAC